MKISTLSTNNDNHAKQIKLSLFRHNKKKNNSNTCKLPVSKSSHDFLSSHKHTMKGQTIIFIQGQIETLQCTNIIYQTLVHPN